MKRRLVLGPQWAASRWLLGLAICVAVGVSVQTGSAQVNLGLAANYTVLGMGGTSGSHGEIEVYQSATVVHGNVGAGPYADWTHGMDGTVNGRVDYDLTGSPPGVTGTVSAGLHQIDMAPVIADARAASAYAAALASTQTFATLTGGQTLVGSGGLNVIRVTGAVDIKTTLNIQGSSSDFFVIQLAVSEGPSAHSLTLSGMQMNLLGGITANRILWNMHGAGGGIVISSGSTVYGTFLAPDRGILVDHGTITGAVMGGGGTDSHSNSISVHSGSNLTAAPVPEPVTMGLAGFALIAAARRRLCKAA